MKYSLLLLISMVIGANAFGQKDTSIPAYSHYYWSDHDGWHHGIINPMRGDTLIISDTSIHFIKWGSRTYFLKDLERVQAFAEGVLLVPGCDSLTDPENGITISTQEISKWKTIGYVGDYPVKWKPSYWFFGQDKEWHEIKDIEKVHKNAGKIKPKKKGGVDGIVVSGWNNLIVDTIHMGTVSYKIRRCVDTLAIRCTAKAINPTPEPPTLWQMIKSAIVFY